MKKVKSIITMILYVFIFNISSASGQQIDTLKELPKYDVWIKLENNNFYKGRLIDLSTKDLTFLYKGDYPRPFPFENQIKSIQLRKKGAIQKGAIIGSLSGLFIGGLTGYIASKPFGCSNCLDIDFDGDKARIWTVGGTIGGGIAGALLGAWKFKIDINGNTELNSDQIYKLEKYGLSPH